MNDKEEHGTHKSASTEYIEFVDYVLGRIERAVSAHHDEYQGNCQYINGNQTARERAREAKAN